MKTPEVISSFLEAAKPIDHLVAATHRAEAKNIARATGSFGCLKQTRLIVSRTIRATGIAPQSLARIAPGGYDPSVIGTSSCSPLWRAVDDLLTERLLRRGLAKVDEGARLRLDAPSANGDHGVNLLQTVGG